MDEPGYLLIWSDIDVQHETDYLHWLTREHTSERVSTEGFLGVRVFRALLADVRRYLILYELESPAALAGPDYLGKLDRPSPWTQRIMPHLGNFIRGGGWIAARAGTGEGGVVAPVVLSEISAEHSRLVADLARDDRIATVRLLQTDPARTSIKTREKALRQGDRSFGGVLLIEGLDTAAVEHALSRLGTMVPELGESHGAPLYTEIFSLDARH